MKNSVDIKNAQFAELEEILNQTKKVSFLKIIADGAGIPVFFSRRNSLLYCEDSECNTIISSSIGTGKTRRLIMPALIAMVIRGENIIVHDPKGELKNFLYSFAKKLGYKQLILNFRNPAFGDSFNILCLAGQFIKKGISEGYAILDNFFASLCESVKSDEDPYWHNSAATYLKCLALVIIREYGPEKCTLDNILKLHYFFNQKEGMYLKGIVYYNNHSDAEEKETIISVLDGATDTRRCIYMLALQAISKYSQNKDICNLLGTSTFSVDDLINNKCILYLITRDENSCYDPIISNYVHCLYERMVQIAEEKYNGTLPIRINYVLDEFSNMSKVPDVIKKISSSRSRKIRFILCMQSFSQLNYIYGNDVAKTLIENCENLIYFHSSNMDFVNMLSERCGIKDDGTPLVSPYMLQHLNKEKGEALVLIKRLSPFFTELPDISELINEENLNIEDIPKRALSSPEIDLELLAPKANEKTNIPNFVSSLEYNEIDTFISELNKLA